MIFFYKLPSVLISSIGIIWICLSIYKQFRPNAINKNNDPFALIPIWTLFSPKPMKNNCLLGYRDLLKDGNITEIRIINNYTPKWYFMLWYGQRRDVKFILGLRKQLIKYKGNEKIFLRTSSFLLIKNYLKNYYFFDANCVEKRQVIYLKRGGWNLSFKDEVLFVSNIDN